jgi:hypothetical protein
MAARLESYIKRCVPGRFAGGAQRVELGVGASETLVVTHPCELAAADHCRPDERVGLDGAPASLGGDQSGSHPEIVVACHTLLFQRLDRLLSFREEGQPWNRARARALASSMPEAAESPPAQATPEV